MLALIQRHPRYTISCALGLLVLLLLQISRDSPSFPPIPRKYSGVGSNQAESDLGWRLQRSEERYQETLKQRKALIRKFGPSKEDILP